jgi:hypothetical protein
MISLEALLLFIIMFCVLFLTICMAAGIFFLVRFHTAFKKIEQQVDALGKTINANVDPVALEIRETAKSVRSLIDTAQHSVSDYTTLTMIRKVSPKLAGLKLGIDLGAKAYNSYMSPENPGKGQDWVSIARKLSRLLSK